MLSDLERVPGLVTYLRLHPIFTAFPLRPQVGRTVARRRHTNVKIGNGPFLYVFGSVLDLTVERERDAKPSAQSLAGEGMRTREERNKLTFEGSQQGNRGQTLF